MKATARMSVLIGVLTGCAPLLFAQSAENVARAGTIGELLAQMPKPTVDGLRKKVIGLDTADSALLFAAAGSVHGSGGTFFRSDATIINHRTVAQKIAIGFIAQGVDNSAELVTYATIPAHTPLIYSDIVGSFLHKSGLGAILITGATSTNGFDSAASLSGYSRIYTPQPNATGTVSQGFPSVSIIDSLGSLVAYAAGLRHDSGYRANAGIVNLDSVTHTWTVGVNGLNGQTSFAVTVLPVSMMQVPVTPGNYGDCLMSFQTTGSGFWWSAYGASVDNITGDGWSSHAFQP